MKRGILKRKSEFKIWVGLLGCVLPFTVVSLGQESPSQWITFAPPKGGFTIQLPVEPSRRDEHEENTPTGKVSLHFFISSAGGCFYGVGWTDYPFVTDVKRQLDSSREGFLKEIKGKLLSEKDVTLKGIPGREFSAEAVESGLSFQSRIYLNGKRGYQIVTGCPPARFEAGDVSKFFNSFDLPAVPATSK